MILTDEYLAFITDKIDELEKDLAYYRKQEIRHYVELAIQRKFGECEPLIDILVDNKGKRYVLEELKTIVEDNYRHGRYGYILLTERPIRKDGHLMRTSNVMYYVDNFRKTGEKRVKPNEE